MKKKAYQLIKRILITLSILMLTAASVPIGVQARGTVDLDKKGTVGLAYQYDKTILPGVKVHLYRIAKINASGEFTLLSPYDDNSRFPVTDINHITDQQQWDALIKPLSAYIYSNGVTADAEGTSDADGKVSFSGLELGLYLIVSDTLRQTDCTYTFSSFLTSVPGLDADDNWTDSVYDVVGVPKCEKTINPKQVSYNVYKRWNDSGYEGQRPSSISVSIYLDGTLYQTQTLSAANNWTYSWTYQEGHVFTIAESTGGSYSVALSESGNDFILTNTYNPNYPDYPPDNPDNPGTPDNPVTPSGQVAGANRTPVSTAGTGAKPAVLGAKRLPQTGQLWWPVPILALAGMALFGTGWYADRKKKS